MDNLHKQKVSLCILKEDGSSFWLSLPKGVYYKFDRKSPLKTIKELDLKVQSRNYSPYVNKEDKETRLALQDDLTCEYCDNLATNSDTGRCDDCTD